MDLCFVSTRRGSHFMTELLLAIAACAEEAGHVVELAFDKFPPLRAENTYVVIPHEFDAWGDPEGFPGPQQCARTIALCTENPGTEWFEATYRLLPRFAAAVSINRSSAAELRRRGIRCEHFQLGYSPLWDSWRSNEGVERNVDVLYLGAADPRRDPLLGSIGRDLWARHCQFLVPPLEPRTGPRADFLEGSQKYHRLRSAKILLNLHRTTSAALEWMRFLEAMCNGCVVVSEPCLDNEPLVPGEHFVAVGVDEMGFVVDRLLNGPESLRRTRARAYEFVRDELPMAPAIELLANLAAELPLQRAATSSPSGNRLPTMPPASLPPQADPATDTESLPEARSDSAAAVPSKLSPRKRRARRRFRNISQRLLNGRRRSARLLDQTPAYADAHPRVTIAFVTGPGRGPQEEEALLSSATSVSREFEVLIFQGASNNRAKSAVSRFVDDSPWLPAALLHQPQCRSLGRSRNALAEHARGEYLFIQDATSGIYPSTLQRLVTALDGDPDATFSYSMVIMLDEDRPVELLSSLPWEPERLRRGNWIDGMVLIRRERLLALGGYSTDPRLDGWEDFDLWCKCADAGGYGVHVPQVLGWRRPTSNPAACPAGHDSQTKWTVMRDRFPELLALPTQGAGRDKIED
jgi:Glycosyl transferase family 2/Glycosyl transferases group 1